MVATCYPQFSAIKYFIKSKKNALGRQSLNAEPQSHHFLPKRVPQFVDTGFRRADLDTPSSFHLGH